MGDSRKWLKALKKRRYLVERLRKIFGGSILAALIVGPLIYFSVCAERAGAPFQTGGDLLHDSRASGQVEIIEGLEDEYEYEVPKRPEIRKLKEGLSPEDLEVEFEDEDLKIKFKEEQEKIQDAIAYDLEDEKEKLLEQAFEEEEDVEIKSIKKQFDEGLEEEMLVMQNVEIDFGPAKVKKLDDAEDVAQDAMRKYIKSLPEKNTIQVLKDTSKIKSGGKRTQLVLSKADNHAGKWYVTFQQYHQGLPVFDGAVKMIFTEEKRLLVLSDNIKRDLPSESEFKVGSALAKEKAKNAFDWDEELDEVKFIDKGYYKQKPSYRVDTDAHNPLGEWQVFVNGVDGGIDNLYGDIRLQDDPPTETPPVEDPPPPETEPIAETPATPPAVPEIVEPIIEAILELPATAEPELLVLDTFFGQILGEIYPKHPNQPLETVPFSDEYVYIGQTEARVTSSRDGYFENADSEWYTTFLDGPYVTVHDDDATGNATLVQDNTPNDPFTWDDSIASQAAINAFYHTNKIRNYFNDNLGFEMNDKIPVTVNSHLVDQYISGCGAWFDNTNKTIEMGRGGTEVCPNDLNYALGSDFVYHEYAHFIVEDITHLPNVPGSEAAAMGEGLADYFAVTINNDPVFGDVIAPDRTRTLDNNLNYQYEMIGESHHDGQIIGGAFWDLRQAIGAEATDQLILDTLYQDRLHFETFMYGMIIEDDDNNDFSDGTPHLIEIITAFENHGIGPGVNNFNGLPIDPEAWAALLEEEVPVGEDGDGLLMSLSAGCDTTTLSGYIYVPTGNTCYVQNATHTFANGLVNGTLLVGGTSTSSTLTINTNDMTVNGSSALIIIGYTTGSTGKDARLNTSGGTTSDLRIYGGGRVYTRTNTYSGVDHYINVTGTILVGSSSSSAGYLDIQDNYTANTSYKLEVHTDLDIDNGRLDVSYYTYIYESAGRIDIDAGYELETNYLALGQNDGSPLGGIMNADGIIDVIYNAYIYEGGDFYCDGTCYMRSLQIYGGPLGAAQLTNNGTFYLDTNGAFWVQIYDRATFTNNSGATAYIRGGISIDEVSVFTYNPTLNNYGYMYVEATSSTYYDNNDLNMYDDSRLNVGIAGTATTARFWINDDIQLWQNATINNYYIFYQGQRLTNTTQSIFQLNDSAIFNNGSASDTTAYFINYRTTVGIEGINRVYETSNFNNYGNADMQRLYVGLATSATGGTFTNQVSGDLDINQTGVSQDCLEIYRGRLDNLSGADDLDIDGRVEIQGISGDRGYLANNDNLARAGRIIVYDYGTLDNNTSTFTIDGNGTAADADLWIYNNNGYVDNDGTLTVNDGLIMYNDSDLENSSAFTVAGEVILNDTSQIDNIGGTANFNTGTTMRNTSDINNSDGATINIGNSDSEDLAMRESSRIDNSGAINVYDDIIMSNETSGGDATFNNSGSGATVTLTSTADNLWLASNSANVSNSTSAIINVDNVAASATDGVFNLLESAVLTNSATIQASVIQVGDGSVDGGSYNNNSGGTTTTTYSGIAFRVYRGLLTNHTGATTLNVTNGGEIYVYGISGSEGMWQNYSTSAGNLWLRSYGDYVGNSGAAHTGTYCDVMQNDTNNALLVNYTGGTINCTTFNIGGTSTYPGLVQNTGGIVAPTMNIYEDAVSTESIEFDNISGGWLYAGILNLGDASNDGGEIVNVSGNGVKDDITGYDGVDVGVLNIYQYGDFYNGAQRTGGAPSNVNAEVNWLASTGSSTVVHARAAGQFHNYANVGGLVVKMDGSLTLGEGTFDNKTTGTGAVESEYIQVESYGVFNNETSATVSLIESLMVMNGADTTGGIFNNSGTATTPLLEVGEFAPATYGGLFNNNSGGSLNVTGTGADAAIVYQGSLQNITGSSLFNVAGEMSVSGDTTFGQVGFGTGSAAAYIGELDIDKYGFVTAYQTVFIDDSGSGNGNLHISGNDAVGYGGLLIQDGTANLFQVDGTTTIADYGRLTNNEVATSFGGVGGFEGIDLVTVSSLGSIDSDDTSQFIFNEGIISAGLVALDDDVLTTDNTTSSNSIEVTAGTFTTGLSSNTGTTTGGNVEVSSGTFNTYNSSSFTDVLVTGATAVANFEDSTTPIDCGTDIKGYFDILSTATAEVNCSNTNDAVYVHSASPGGNTQVEGTLILNTNLETETMIVGDGVSAAGIVTHDLAPDNITPADFSEVFKLTVTDTLTIKSNGSLDVSEKSKYKNSVGSESGQYLGGSHGGKGQYDGTSDTPYGENGEVSNDLDMMGSMGKLNSDSLGGWGGGIMNIYVGTASGDPLVEPTGTLINSGIITADGMNLDAAAGSGGAINLYLHNTITGSGPITAIGGDSTGTVFAYDTSGGGGRIHMEYYDKSGYTGYVSALGGEGANTGENAGTGTIFYLWTDKWQNQNDGTLFMDAYDYVNTAVSVADIDNSGTLNSIDYTTFPTITYGQNVINIESIQVAEDALLYVTRNSYMQQCLVDTSGAVYTSLSPTYINRDHGPTSLAANVCHETPDPPATLYVNDTGTTAQGGKPGTKSDIKPLIPDTTPSMSAVHKDGTLDNTTTAETPTHDVYEYQLIIGESVTDVWTDTAITNCDIDSTRFADDNDYAHNARTNDILIPSACGANLSATNTFYWKVRFLEDQDDNYATTTDQFWGLWSETNQFEISEGGAITVKSCTSGTGAINLALDLGVPTQFDEEKCLISVDSTTDINITANKDQTLTDSVTSGTFIDMEATDDYLDGKKIYSSTDFFAEVAFRLDNFGGITTNMSAQTDTNQGSGLAYDNETCPSPPAGALPCWHKLQTGASTNDTIIQALSAAVDEYFDFYLGAYIPMTDIDDSSTEAGDFTATATLTLWSNP